jgi:hypothetical protein
MHVIGHPADRKNLVFVLLNIGDNVFVELISPTILDHKLPRDASLRDAEMICAGFLPKEASLRDAVKHYLLSIASCRDASFGRKGYHV